MKCVAGLSVGSDEDEATSRSVVNRRRVGGERKEPAGLRVFTWTLRMP
jgi:hypothetical protein